MPKRDVFVAAAERAVFSPRAPQEFWLDGETVMCACPDCGAPVSIRTWLLIADCWKCGCSIELTKAQERRLHSMLRNPSAKHATAAPPSQRGFPAETPTPRLPNREEPKRHNAPRSSSTRPTAMPAVRPERRNTWRNWFEQMPAWLVSMLFHMALLALLALLFFEGDPEEDPYITLSTEANRWVRSGGSVEIQKPEDRFEYDLPIPKSEAPKTPREHAAMLKADQAARELRVAPGTRSNRAPVEQVKQVLRSTDAANRTLAARDPRVRVEVIQREGGTTLTEAAVARGLRWLAQHQSEDGSWSLHRFSQCDGCRGKCGGRASVRSDSAGTSLALLPFLGAGQTHQSGIYRDNVAKGLRWLIENQKSDGDLRAGANGNPGMYAHGQGAIVLCEAYALTGDEQLRDAAQRSIDFILDAQHRAGGWRYHPGDAGDTSVLGWQLMAMQSARAARLEVPQDAFTLAYAYLDSVQYDDGSRYAYQPERKPTHVMTAEALLCRMYMGWKKGFAPLDLGVRYLSREHEPNRHGTNFYYWYYATQVMHHYGGNPWKKWNLSMRDILVRSQIRRGHEAGSWDPRGGHASQGGRIYSTAMAVCTLEVYYRHAPIFRQLDLD